MMNATRRQFMYAVAGSSLLLAGDVPATAQPAASPAPKIRVRRDIYSLAPNGPELAALRRGVAAMKARPVSDPTSWLFQANIHGTNDPAPPAVADVWNSCQHGTFFFLSWHRLYLYFFEKILRAASANDDFALPYWNYAVPAQRSLPAAFRTPANTSNPLYVVQRRQTINAGSAVPASAVGANQALATINFASPTGSGSSFGGQIVAAPVHFAGTHGRLESQPHDVMHGVIGGNSGWMSDPNLAARDPIFWLHHCNVDRLWNRWLALAGGRTNPVSNNVWMTTKFTFYDEQKNRVMMTGAEVLDASRQLLYRYDDDPVPVGPLVVAAGPTESVTPPGGAPESVVASSPPAAPTMALGIKPTTLTLQPTSTGAIESAVAPGSAPVVLSFDDIAYRRPTGVYYEVYVNKPPTTTPDPQGPYYAGNLALFALGHAHGEGVSGGRVTLDVSGVLARQRELGLWPGGQVKIDLVPQGVDDIPETPQAAPIATIGQVRILRQ